MGLDIRAYKNLTEVINPELDEDGDNVHWDTEWTPGASMKWSEKHFPGRGEGIDADKTYKWEDTYGFRAGSYSGYNRWRRALERFAVNKAFYELTEFADNEGVIGFVVAKKLAKDFADYEEQAKAYAKELGEEGEYWLEKYYDWKQAFEMASENGAVEFR